MNEHVTQYISKAPAEQREIMESIRQIIHEEVPTVKENFKWSRPVFTANGDFIYFKSFKDYFTLGIFKFTKITVYKELLEGTGKDMRHIKMKGPEDVNPGIIRSLIRQMIVS